MSFILALESATKTCSVSLIQSGKILACKEVKGDYSHAENLASFVDALLQEANLTPDRLVAVAVSKGPGSYTGLRIGTSLAKGLCYSLNIPLISISTLKSIAWGVQQQLDTSAEFFICPMIDARRMEAYTAVYNSKLEILQEISATELDSATFLDYLNKDLVYFAGDGAAKYQEVVKHGNARFFEEDGISSINMAELAQAKFDAEEFEDVAYFEPYYHKEFVAIKGKKLI